MIGDNSIPIKAKNEIQISGFDIMNTLLFYEECKKTDNKQYLKAKTGLTRLSADEKEDLLSWWSNTELVGEKESKLALSLINNT